MPALRALAAGLLLLALAGCGMYGSLYLEEQESLPAAAEPAAPAEPAQDEAQDEDEDQDSSGYDAAGTP